MSSQGSGVENVPTTNPKILGLTSLMSLKRLDLEKQIKELICQTKLNFRPSNSPLELSCEDKLQIIQADGFCCLCGNKGTWPGLERNAIMDIDLILYRLPSGAPVTCDYQRCLGSFTFLFCEHCMPKATMHSMFKRKRAFALFWIWAAASCGILSVLAFLFLANGIWGVLFFIPALCFAIAVLYTFQNLDSSGAQLSMYEKAANSIWYGNQRELIQCCGSGLVGLAVDGHYYEPEPHLLKPTGFHSDKVFRDERGNDWISPRKSSELGGHRVKG